MTSKPTGKSTQQPVLSPSEKDILQMIADGYKVDDIGGILALPETEVRSLLTAAEEKLGAKNRLHAVTIAVLHGHIAIGPHDPE